MKLSELSKYNPIIIQCHDNPDADAIASAFALYTYFKQSQKKVRIIYSGDYEIQKSNLVIMVKELSIPIEYVPRDTKLSDLKEDGILITVDCQYGAGNVSHFDAKNVAIIDHHQEEISNIPLSDIRSNYGSCSTVIWNMMVKENFDFSAQTDLGTALYYGLYSDTNSFSEIRNPIDMDLRDSIPFSASLVSTLRNSNISLKELEIAGIALIRYIINEEHQFAIIKSQPCDPNILGLISDLVLQVDCVKTCVVYNETDAGIKFSVRSCTKEVKASELAAFLAADIGSGGGHLEKAGGFIGRGLYQKYYSSLHTEAFFSQKLTDYFDNTLVIYASTYDIDMSGMSKYAKKPLHLGYVDPTDIFDTGTALTVRTLEGDLDVIADGSFYLMIGIKGEVYPIKKDRFLASYQKLDGEFKFEGEYEPTVKNQFNGKTEQILEFARPCITTGTTHIHAREISKRTKIFTAWDQEKYVLGVPGDFIAVRCDDIHDIYIVERDIFFKTYNML